MHTHLAHLAEFAFLLWQVARLTQRTFLLGLPPEAQGERELIPRTTTATLTSGMKHSVGHRDDNTNFTILQFFYQGYRATNTMQ